MLPNINLRKYLPFFWGVIYRFKHKLKRKKLFGGPRVNFPLERSVYRKTKLINIGSVNNKTEDANFIVYRIIGNDLPPRHQKGQSLENLRFILEHETDLPNCEKRFVVNRIVLPEVEDAVLTLLEEHGFKYIHIPFKIEEYRKKCWDVEGVPTKYAPYGREYARLNGDEKSRLQMRLFRHKNNYVMNNNGARNAALEEGRQLAKWVLPWDGNCFITKKAWQDIVEGISAYSDVPYFVVPMARLTNNFDLLKPDFQPSAREEPQLVFHCDSNEIFDENFYYGRRPKVELFWRLGIPGPWDYWPIEPWDLPCPNYSEMKGCYATVGWVARLFSGHAQLENNGAALIDRGSARNNAIQTLLDELDDEALRSPRPCSRLIFTKLKKINLSENNHEDFFLTLSNFASEALQRGPYSVVDKKTLPPSKNAHDYWHPSPYFWPNPITKLPYIKKDGKRVPGTRLYEALSDNYDRTRLQRLFDDTFTLALAGSFFQEDSYDLHAVDLIRTWFLNPATAMTPHLEYSQVCRGWNKNRGSSSGLIEAKDFYYLLDAVRLLEKRGKMPESDSHALREWLYNYLYWLRTSPQGVKERASQNNHGTYYDLQVGAIAAFLGEDTLLRHTLKDSRFRIVQQFAADGSQPEELKRTTTAHYCCFNLQGWIHLAQLADSCGEDLWYFEGPQGQGLRKAMEWLLPYMKKEWPYQQINAFDTERFYPIYYEYVSRYGKLSGLEQLEIPRQEEVKPVFFPHDGIRPFWQLS